VLAFPPALPNPGSSLGSAGTVWGYLQAQRGRWGRWPSATRKDGQSKTQSGNGEGVFKSVGHLRAGKENSLRRWGRKRK